ARARSVDGTVRPRAFGCRRHMNLRACYFLIIIVIRHETTAAEHCVRATIPIIAAFARTPRSKISLPGHFPADLPVHRRAAFCRAAARAPRAATRPLRRREA